MGLEAGQALWGNLSVLSSKVGAIEGGPSGSL